MIFAVWVSDNEFVTEALNHQQYCNKNGYKYKHFYLTSNDFAIKYGRDVRPYWYKVIISGDLLYSNLSEYYLYLDMDVVFTRYDFRLENLIHSSNRYSLYTQTAKNKFFMPTQSFIIKGNSDFSFKFIREWTEYRNSGYCKDISGEQGAFMLSVATFLSEYAGNVKYPYVCSKNCFSEAHKRQNSYHRYSCVLDWFHDYAKGNNNSLPSNDIYFAQRDKLEDVPYTNIETLTYNIGVYDQHKYIDEFRGYNVSMNYSIITAHPCKFVPYVEPSIALSECINSTKINRKSQE